jgi:hypothetical protein
MKNQPPTPTTGIADRFLSKFGRHVTTVLSGFDRLRFRATLRLLFVPAKMEAYLSNCHVLIKNFKTFAEATTARVKAAAYATADAAGRPTQYLPSPEISKEDRARQIAREDRIQQGLIVLFSAVEPCLSYAVRGDPKTKRIHLVLETRKCTHLYHYLAHPDFGLTSVRVQTWFPFTVDVCLNGREWLARQMDRAGLSYQQKDNCFVKISDPHKAQELLDQQLHITWPLVLQPLLEQAHPLHAELGRPLGQNYYWSASQTEYATDLVFKDATQLAALYPRFVHHGIQTFGSRDVLRFLGHGAPSRFRGELSSNLKHRPEGLCLRHRANGNSIKIYDKHGSVLRVETTIVHPRCFKVYRPAHRDPQQPLQWQKLRKSVADLWRRAEVSRAANGRYLDALASLSDKTPLHREAVQVARPVTVEGRRFRALNPWSPADGALLEAVSQGEYVLAGFRNRDLRPRLYPAHSTEEQQKRQAAAVTRRLALLHAHGLIKKVTGTHRWMLTTKGRRIITALLAARQADVEQLTQLAA